MFCFDITSFEMLICFAVLHSLIKPVLEMAKPEARINADLVSVLRLLADVGSWSASGGYPG